MAFRRSASLCGETLSVVQKNSNPPSAAALAVYPSRSRKQAVQRAPPSGSPSRPRAAAVKAAPSYSQGSSATSGCSSRRTRSWCSSRRAYSASGWMLGS